MGDSVPPLHVVTDDSVVARAGFLDDARRVVEAGGSRVALHLRAPGASGRRMHGLGVALRRMTADAGARLIVNDRADVALAVDADGVQAGGRGMRAADVRRVLGAGRMLGVSVHAAHEARDALAAAPGFLLAGTIWETASHPGRPGAGAGRIRELAALGVPVIAIGGVTPARAAEARDAGAAGVAALRGVWDVPDVAAAVFGYLSHWVER